MGETARAHVVIPKELLAEIDALVGKRKRSEFIVESLATKVKRERRLAMSHQLRGSIAEGEVPAWDTIESTAGWQKAQRPIDDPWHNAERAAS